MTFLHDPFFWALISMFGLVAACAVVGSKKVGRFCTVPPLASPWHHCGGRDSSFLSLLKRRAWNAPWGKPIWRIKRGCGAVSFQACLFSGDDLCRTR